MKMFLVDHSYGACIVIAHNKREAAEMGDAIGDVFAVHEIDLPIVLSIGREEIADFPGEEHTVLTLEGNEDWDYSDDLQKLMTEHGVALDQEEYAALPAYKQAGGPPRPRRATSTKSS